MPMMFLRFAIVVCFTSLPSTPVWSAELTKEQQHFDRVIAPLLARRCLDCHSGAELKGDLDLSQKKSAFAGGESGEAIMPGKPDESLLWEYVRDDEMPPKTPLSAAEKRLLKDWIAAGAHWGTDTIDPFKYSSDSRAGYDWWSLLPLADVKPLAGDKNPIDTFVRAKLAEKNLLPSPPADRLTLIRRVTFDVIGLPPTPAEIDAFAADKSPQAYEHLVDRLLKSPHYGERWARTWLDVVRFGESNGFEYDQPRDNAWHYRNWVIDALNRDLPYDQFVRMQLAGDLLEPGTHDGVAAVGFLVAGAHNTTLPASDKMRKSMQQDEYEDLVAVVGQTFLGLTVNCARCHDHKFDPISQTDYYRMVATFAGVAHGERDLPDANEKQRLAKIKDLDQNVKRLNAQLSAIDKIGREAVLAERKAGDVSPPALPQPLARWEFDGDLRDSIGNLHGTAKGSARLDGGGLLLDGSSHVETAPLAHKLEEKTLEAWIELKNLDQRGGGVIGVQTRDGSLFDAIVFGEQEPRRWMAGSNSFQRTQSFVGAEQTAAQDRPIHFAITYSKDGTITGYRDGVPYGKAYKIAGLQAFEAGNSQVVFGVRHTPAGSNKMLTGTILRAQLYDHVLSPDAIAASAGVETNYVAETDLVARLSDSQLADRAGLKKTIADISAERKQLTQFKRDKIYTAVSRKPATGHVLLRGNVSTLGDVVSPGGIGAIASRGADFELAPDAPDADRRLKLAAWITQADNPLFARVIVNRIWHYHFGQGIVDTPSDFGFNGGRASHPELLDHLASTLKQDGWSLKRLHRKIVLSATYRQANENPQDNAHAIDADNRLLWHMDPRRLEAEAIRDGILSIAGQLNPEVGGPGYRDVRHYQFKGSNFYELLDEDGPQFNRRTIYRFQPRGGRNPLLDTFDCPDPSATAPKRAVTTTPLQALALLNNPFVFRMADEMAKRVERDTSGSKPAAIDQIYRLVYGRHAEPDEIKTAQTFVESHGMWAFCRVVFNSNEFLYVK